MYMSEAGRWWGEAAGRVYCCGSDGISPRAPTNISRCLSDCCFYGIRAVRGVLDASTVTVQAKHYIHASVIGQW